MRLNSERQDAIKVIMKANDAAFGLNQEIMNFTVCSFRGFCSLLLFTIADSQSQSLHYFAVTLIEKAFLSPSSFSKRFWNISQSFPSVSCSNQLVLIKPTTTQISFPSRSERAALHSSDERCGSTILRSSHANIFMHSESSSRAFAHFNDHHHYVMRLRYK